MPGIQYSLPDTPPEQHASLHEQVRSTFESVAGVISASIKPLPKQTGDGSYVQTTKPAGSVNDLTKMHPKDLNTIIELAKASLTGAPVNDRTLLMERLIQLTSELSLTSKHGAQLSDIFVQQLYDDLQHPPVASLGHDHKYRAADGSFNNPMAPMVGAAGTPYARTVRPQTLQPLDRPDAGDLFDSLMARDEFEPHPAKLSSMLFYLGSIIIHDLFRTDRKTGNNATSSYLELSPLYGDNQEEQDAVRTFRDGKIKTDCFSNKRVLGFPPGVSVLLIMFNRFHNHVASQLAAVNECGRFTKPEEGASKDTWATYDNDLFQTARLINCGLYVNIILKDYVRTILDLNRTESDWDLDPRTATLKGPNANGTPGNQVSAEFNLVYRWHAAISVKDDEWTQQAYSRLFPGKEPSQISLPELLQGLARWEQSLPSDPQERVIASLKHSKANIMNTNGTLNDSTLVEILTESIEDQAGAFGAKNVPEILRSIEILGIKQARSWNLASLNEFRSFFGLTRHETFESINSDPDVANALRAFYDEPDFVELYPGLAVEESKPQLLPGSGLCTNYTISRAILSDAVALVRGDRFYTVDYSPNNLTNWGFNEVSSDVTVDHGHVIYKLFLRAFPQHFQPNSIYVHFPFVIPAENLTIMAELEEKDKYTWEHPKYVPLPTFITSYAACTSILDNQVDFKVTWGTAIKLLMHNSGKAYGADFMLSGDAAPNTQSRGVMKSALYRKDWEDAVKGFYKNITLQLLRKNSYLIGGATQVDIVRDVGNLAQAHFAAEVFCLPLKTAENPHGIYSDSQLYTLMALVFTCIFYDADPAKSFPLRQAARKLTQQLGQIMELLVIPELTHSLVGNLLEHLHKKKSVLSMYGSHMILQLYKSGLGAKDLIWSQILPTAGGMVANQGQLFAQCLDFYLSDEAAPHLKEINRLAKLDTDAADELLLRYFMEASRIRATVGLYRAAAKENTIQDGEKSIVIKPGDEVLCDLVAACMDPAAFPEPDKIKLDRSLDSYIQFGWGPHLCLGYDVCKLALTTMLKTVGQLDNLRRAPGSQGQIKKVAGPGGITMYMTPNQASFFPFPTTMKVRWDGALPLVNQ